jgi:uroporphyrin-III C-methyltransferase/precorrin-2 dehydrogenase/sirohydrochlorin ferrochelatase
VTRRGPNPGTRGLVSLVGAGPGDPELLTVRALARLRAADLILYDGLISPEILALARGAVLESVARRVGVKTLSEAAVIARMVDASSQGFQVVRLKSGDPFIFGRGGEETAALAAAGVPFEVVPGVTTALAAPALCGIPVTHRKVSSAVLMLSGHAAASYGPLVDALPPGAATLVFLMGLGQRTAIRRRLLKRGWPPATPTAIVINASLAEQRLWSGRLDTLGLGDRIGGTSAPGVIIVGNTVAYATPFEDPHS